MIVGEPFRGDQQDVHLVPSEGNLDRGPIVLVGRVDRASQHAHALRSGDLIPHQCQQRRNQYGGTHPVLPATAGSQRSRQSSYPTLSSAPPASGRGLPPSDGSPPPARCERWRWDSAWRDGEVRGRGSAGKAWGNGSIVQAVRTLGPGTNEDRMAFSQSWLPRFRLFVPGGRIPWTRYNNPARGLQRRAKAAQTTPQTRT